MRYIEPPFSREKTERFIIDAGLGASWHINDSLRMFTQADYICVWNSLNRQDVNEQDFQLVLGAKYSL